MWRFFGGTPQPFGGERGRISSDPDPIAHLRIVPAAGATMVRSSGRKMKQSAKLAFLESHSDDWEVSGGARVLTSE